MIFDTGDENASLAAGCTLSVSQRYEPDHHGAVEDQRRIESDLFHPADAVHKERRGHAAIAASVGGNGATSAVIGANA